MYKRVWYDNFNNQMHLWVGDGKGGSNKAIFDHMIEYYTQDVSGLSDIKDIYGNPVIKLQSADKRRIYSMKEQGYKLCESDIAEEVKFVQKRYAKSNLKVNMADWKIGFFDIEVDCDRFPDPKLALFPVDLISLYNSKDGKVYIFGAKKYTKELPKNWRYMCCETEKDLLNSFFTFCNKCDFDIYSGFNCVDKQSYVYHNSYIDTLENSFVGDKLGEFGEIVNKSPISLKKTIRIKLSDGTTIKSSFDHIWPVYSIDQKGRYLFDRKIIESEIKASEISKGMYLKKTSRININGSASFFDLISSKGMTETFNFVMDDKKTVEIVKKATNVPYPQSKVKNYPGYWCYENLKKIIRIDLKEWLCDQESVCVRPIKFLTDRIDLSEIIDDDYFYLLGMIYTDGCLIKTKNWYGCIYNTDIKIINHCCEILRKFGINFDLKYPHVAGEKNDFNARKTICRIRFTFKSNFRLLILSKLIYGDDNKKRINLKLLSMISKKQFLSFFSGLIDGDGSVDGKSVCVCNYEKNDDLNRLKLLLEWNGINSTLSKHHIRVSRRNNEKPDLKLFHSVKSKKFKNISSPLIQNKASCHKKHPSNMILFNGDRYIKIKEVEFTEELTEMIDIKTESGYFSCNGFRTHNCNNFDLTYLENRRKQLGIKKNFSPVGKIDEDAHGNFYVAGAIMLDYMLLYQEFDKTNLESYSLDFISKHVLGHGKLYNDGGLNAKDKAWEEYVKYNVNDTMLIKELDDKLGLIEFAISIAYQALIPVPRVMSTISIITGYMLKFMHERNIVLNDRIDVSSSEYPGAYTNSIPGYYERVSSFDVVSLYPSILMQFNISPETLVKYPEDDEIENLIKTPIEGIYYKRTPGILPLITQEVFNQKKLYKQLQLVATSIEHGVNDVEQISKDLRLPKERINELIDRINEEQGDSKYYKRSGNITKIIVNSIYGVLGNPYFHFYNVDNATAVTQAGKAMIQYLSKNINSFLRHGSYRGKKWALDTDTVVLLDTDSCYVCLDEIFKQTGVETPDTKSLIDRNLEFVDEIMKPFFKKILDEYANSYKVEQLINFKHEKIISQQIVLAKKRYTAKFVYKEGITYDPPEVDYVGVEVVRSSTPRFCRDKLKSTIEYIFDEINKPNAKMRLLERIVSIKEQFYKQHEDEIAFPRGIKTFDKYVEYPIEQYVKNGLSFKSRAPIQAKAALTYNYLIEKYKLPLQPATQGAKIRFIYVKPNQFGVSSVGFLGNYPKEFREFFEIDYEKEFETGFSNTIQEFFNVVGWGNIEFNYVDTEGLVEW